MMKNIGWCGLVLGLAALTQAQSVNVRGKVTDAAGKPVANAEAELTGLKLKVNTGVDGMFSMQSVTETFRNSRVAMHGQMSLAKGILELVVADAAPIRIEIFDVKGNRLDRLRMDRATAGIYRLDLMGRVRSETMLIVMASVGKAAKAFPYFAKPEGRRADASLEFSAATGARLAKVSAVVDTLKVSAAGFASRKLPLAKLDTALNVVLEASAGDRWGGSNNPPMKSSGCGKPALKSGTYSMSSAGLNRQYILNVPANYNPDKPSRLIFTMHWMNGSMTAVKNSNFYSYILYDTEKTLLLVAPQGYTDASPWRGGDDKDHTFFEDLHRHLLGNLCVDSSRVFMTGFSFGGMVTNALSKTHQKLLRAAAGLAPANWAIYIPKSTGEPLAWMQTTGMKDQTCPWVRSDAQKQGAKYIAIEHATDNGCTIPPGNNIPTWQSGGHFCHDFQGCKAGYPVKACTFGGAHTDLNSDPGSTVNWLHTVSWNFFKQF